MNSTAKRLKHQGRETKQPHLVVVKSHNEFWHSTLFNDVYLENDLPINKNEMWANEEFGQFPLFLNQFTNFCGTLRNEDMDSWSERTTINRFVKPILRMLGYTNNCTVDQEPWAEDEPFTTSENGKPKVYKPDLIVVNKPAELKYIEKKEKEEKLTEASSSVIVAIEAKYWDRIERTNINKKEDLTRADKKNKKDAAEDLEFEFDKQCLKYMEVLNLDYGILTDGKTWRLYNKELSLENHRRCYQFNLGKLVSHVQAGLDKNPHDYKLFVEQAKYFYHFFSKEALYNENGERFVDELVRHSKKYVSSIDESLKHRFVNAMSMACNAFDKNCKPKLENISLLRNSCESFLFNILFIRYCESRNILPLRQNPGYRLVSLSNIIDKLEHYDPSKENDNLNTPVLVRKFEKDFAYTTSGTELYDRILQLHDVVQKGASKEFSSLKIHGFKQSVFSKEEMSFLWENKIPNSELVKIIFELTYTDASEVKWKKFQQIAYNVFTARQLGTIYESFLEFKITRATENKVRKGSEWVPTTEVKSKVDEEVVKKGQLYFFRNNEDRRSSGSYFTPDWVVNFIVAKTLQSDVFNKSTKEILAVKICDPAMGSGHFLNACLNYLTTQYLKAAYIEQDGEIDKRVKEAKKLVLESCIFGVDLNSRAVKLAKLSLWLETANADSELQKLDAQLLEGNSLIPRSTLSAGEKQQFPAAFDWNAFDTSEMVFVGNPPWGAKMSELEKHKIAELYQLDNENLNTFEAFMLLPSLIKNKKTTFIIPRNFIRTDGYEKGRRLLLQKQNLLSVADFGACFDGVTQEAVTIELSTEPPVQAGVELIPFAKFGNFAAAGRIKQKDILAESKVRFNLTYSDKLERLAKQMESTKYRLSDLVEHFRGIEYGKTGEVTACVACGHHNSLPKKKNNSKKCHECGTTIKLENAKVKKFISRDQTTKHNVPIVVGKVVGRYSCNEFYYMERNVKGIDYKPHAFRDEPKILLMKISDRIKGYLDLENSYATQGIYMLYSRDSKRIPLGVVLAILNSKILQFYYEYRVNVGAELTTNVILEDILKLPFPDLDLADKKVLSSIDSLVKKLQTSLKKGDQEAADKFEAEISCVVNDLYNLSREDEKTIDGFVANLTPANQNELEGDD